MGITIICSDSLKARPIQLTYGDTWGKNVPTAAPNTREIMIFLERLFALAKAAPNNYYIYIFNLFGKILRAIG